MSGITVVPRWTLNPAPGIGEHEATVPVELVAELRRLAYGLKAPLSAVLLTAHAKVLGALSGGREVWTGYAADGSPPLPCRLTIGPRSWREVLRDIARAQSDPLGHTVPPAEILPREGGLTEPLFEPVFELSAGAGHLTKGALLHVAFVQGDGLPPQRTKTVRAGGPGLGLRLGYRTEMLDA